MDFLNFIDKQPRICIECRNEHRTCVMNMKNDSFDPVEICINCIKKQNGEKQNSYGKEIIFNVNETNDQ